VKVISFGLTPEKWIWPDPGKVGVKKGRVLREKRKSRTKLKPSRLSEEQIIAKLKKAEGEPVKTVCARHNISQATHYQLEECWVFQR
jgi:hypothetical protein